jgi:hypothetical protein
VVVVLLLLLLPLPERVSSHHLLRLSLVALIVLPRLHRVHATSTAAAAKSLIEPACVSAARHVVVAPLQFGRLQEVLV